MSVAQVDIDEPGREVEDAALAGVKPGSLRAGDDERRESALRRPGDEDVILGVLGDRGGVDRTLGVERHEESEHTAACAKRSRLAAERGEGRASRLRVRS